MTTNTSLSHYPPLKWADRREYVFLTVDLQDTRDVCMRIDNDGAVLHFSCTAGHTKSCESDVSGTSHYACDIELFHPVSPEESQNVVCPRDVKLKLKKKGDEDVRWTRLTKEKVKGLPIVVDWAEWLDSDEDEDEEQDEQNFTDFGMSDDELASKLRGSNENDLAKELNIDPSTMPSFGSAAGQKPISDEEFSKAAEDDDEMPPLEEITH